MEIPLEGLRGVAALLVALSHLWGMGALMSQRAVPGWLRPFEAGHASVLVFFVISGYVIGLTNPVPPTALNIRKYILRRIVRLLPIYWIALGLTAIVAVSLPWPHWVAFVAFLQNNNSYFGWLIPPPTYNTPLWSLHYECIFYGAFLFLWYNPHWYLRSVLICFLTSLIALFFTSFPQFVAGWTTGWIFWSAGWWIARQPRTVVGGGAPMLSGIFLLLAVHNLRCGDLLAGLIGIPTTGSRAVVNFTNLAILPCCLLLVCGATERRGRYIVAVWVAAFAIPLGAASILCARGRLFEFPNWAGGAAFVLFAIAALPIRGCRWLFRFASFGSISYAFYLIHMPMLFVFRALGFGSDSPGPFAFAACLWFLTSAGIAALLERWMQPRIKVCALRTLLPAVL